MTPRTWTLTIPGKLWTHNAERTRHWSWRAKMARPWRRDAGIMALEAQVPHLDRCTITVDVEQLRGKLADPGAHAGPAKAAIDGIVDAGVLDDDDGSHVLNVDYHPPTRSTCGLDRLVLTITEAE